MALSQISRCLESFSIKYANKHLYIQLVMLLVSSFIVFPGSLAYSSPDGFKSYAKPKKTTTVNTSSQDPDKLMIIDCLLPGQLIQMGTKMMYQTEPEPVRTSAIDCEIRGGKYVAFDRADYRTALNVWLPQAKSGDPAAQNYVGEIYEKGLGVQTNYELALAWYKKAAIQGDTSAQLNVGYMYEKGLGTEKNMTEALNWYRKASGIEDTDLVMTTAVAISQQDDKIRELTTEVNRLSGELDSTILRLEQQKQQLKKSENQINKLKNQLNSTNDSGTIANIQKKITAEQSRLESLRGEVIILEDYYKQQNQKLTQSSQIYQEVASSPEYSNSGPAIEIINPPVEAIRGSPTIELHSTVSEKLVVGNVFAPAGIANVRVNGEDYATDKFGTFRVTIPVVSEKTPVEVVATDQQGRTSSFDFSLIAKANAFASDKLSSANKLPSAEFGSYYALIIGNDQYPYLSDLTTAGNDAKYAEQLLRGKYGFKTQLLLNATRSNILNALNDYRNKLTDQDNLLIFYAGHGELIPGYEDHELGKIQGYWLPVDAEPNKNTNWISNRVVTDILDSMATKHVLVIADSCYSGSLTRTSLPSLGGAASPEVRAKWVKVMRQNRSRKVLSSGGIKPVLDRGGGRHSIFAKILFNTLENNQDVIVIGDIYAQVVDKVQRLASDYNVDQVPQYGPIKFGGHDGGEFFFVPKDVKRVSLGVFISKS